MIKRTSLSVLLGVAIAATPAMGQGMHEHGQAEGSMAGRDMGAHLMAFMPAVVLDAAETLGLDADQKAAIEAIQTQAGMQHGEHMQAARAAGEGACSALSADAVDWDVYSHDMSQRAEHMVLAHVTTLRAASEARALLTPEQIAALEAEAGMSSMGMDHDAMQGRGEMDHDAMQGEMDHDAMQGGESMGSMGSAGMMGMIGMCRG